MSAFTRDQTIGAHTAEQGVSARLTECIHRRVHLRAAPALGPIVARAASAPGRVLQSTHNGVVRSAPPLAERFQPFLGDDSPCSASGGRVVTERPISDKGEITLDAPSESTAQHGQFRKRHQPELGASQSGIAKSESDVRSGRVDLGQQPCGRGIREEEFHDGKRVVPS